MQQNNPPPPSICMSLILLLIVYIYVCVFVYIYIYLKVIVLKHELKSASLICQNVYFQMVYAKIWNKNLVYKIFIICSFHSQHICLPNSFFPVVTMNKDWGFSENLRFFEILWIQYIRLSLSLNKMTLNEMTRFTKLIWLKLFINWFIISRGGF